MKWIPSVGLFVIAHRLGGAQAAELNYLAGTCPDTYDENEDYFPDKAYPEYAETFTVEYFNSYKIVAESNTGKNYVLYQCGTDMPNITDIEVEEYISVPVTKVAVGYTTTVPRLELLGELESVVAWTTDDSLLSSACLTELISTEETALAFYNDPNCSYIWSTERINNTQLAALGVEVSFSGGELTDSCNDTSTEDLLHAVITQDYLETGGEYTALERAEWIKFFSYFYNQEATANAKFGEIESLLMCTSGNAEACSLELEDVPSVAWVSYYYNKSYNAPSTEVYYDYAITQAGGTMVTCDKTDLFYPDNQMTSDEMVECFGDADVCVFAVDYTTVDDPDALAQLKCVQNERVYDNVLAGTNAWFEGSIAEPQVVLEDLVVALHGDDFDYGLGDYERKLLRDVFTEDVGSGTFYNEGSCADTSAERELTDTCIDVIDICPAGMVVPSLLAPLAAAVAAVALLW